MFRLASMTLLPSAVHQHPATKRYASSSGWYAVDSAAPTRAPSKPLMPTQAVPPKPETKAPQKVAEPLDIFRAMAAEDAKTLLKPNQHGKNLHLVAGDEEAFPRDHFCPSFSCAAFALADYSGLTPQTFQEERTSTRCAVAVGPVDDARFIASSGKFKQGDVVVCYDQLTNQAYHYGRLFPTPDGWMVAHKLGSLAVYLSDLSRFCNDRRLAGPLVVLRYPKDVVAASRINTQVAQWIGTHFS